MRGHVRTNAPSPERSEHHTAPSGAVTIAGPVMRPFVPSQHAGGCGTSTCRVACVLASMCSRLGSAVWSARTPTSCAAQQPQSGSIAIIGGDGPHS